MISESTPTSTSQPSFHRLTLPPIGDIIVSQPKKEISHISNLSPRDNSNSIVYNYIIEAECSAQEILKRISELKEKQNPTKLDTIWLAHYVSCLNSSFYQIHACLGNPPNKSSALNDSSINHLVQASLQASRMPVVPQPLHPQSSKSKPLQFTSFDPIKLETTPQTSSPNSHSSNPSSPESFCSNNSRDTPKRKFSEDGGNSFIHQPHKRAYKHSAPTATNDRRCTSCNTTVTPEWRRGPLGPKSLCNACGLQFAKTLK